MARKTQLEDMLLECRQFDEQHLEFDRWYVSAEDEFEAAMADVGGTVTEVEKQIEVNKVRFLSNTCVKTRCVSNKNFFYSGSSSTFLNC